MYKEKKRNNNGGGVRETKSPQYGKQDFYFIYLICN